MPPSFDVIPGDSLVEQEGGSSLQRVLLVTDRVRERHVLMSALDNLPVASAFASSTEDALRLADSLRPDVVVVDVELEGEEGWQICEKLLEEAGAESVDGIGTKPWNPAFVVLHGSAEGVEERARANGLDQMLRWPFAVDEARSLLDLALEKAPEFDNPVSRVSVEITAEVPVEVSADEPRTLLSPALDSSAFADARAMLDSEKVPKKASPSSGSGAAAADESESRAQENSDPRGLADREEGAAWVEEQADQDGPEPAMWELTEITPVGLGLPLEQVLEMQDLPLQSHSDDFASLPPEDEPEVGQSVETREALEKDASEARSISSNLPGWGATLVPQLSAEEHEDALIDRLLVEVKVEEAVVTGASSMDADRSVVEQQANVQPAGNASFVAEEDGAAGEEAASTGSPSPLALEGGLVAGEQEALSPILSDLFSVDGVSQVMLLECGGSVVFTSSKTPQFSLAQLADHSVQIFQSSDLLLGGAGSYSDGDQTEETDSIVVEGDNCCVLLQRVDALHRLVVCVENAAGLGQVRFMIRRLRPRLRRALES